MCSESNLRIATVFIACAALMAFGIFAILRSIDSYRNPSIRAGQSDQTSILYPGVIFCAPEQTLRLVECMPLVKGEGCNVTQLTDSCLWMPPQFTYTDTKSAVSVSFWVTNNASLFDGVALSFPSGDSDAIAYAQQGVPPAGDMVSSRGLTIVQLYVSQRVNVWGKATPLQFQLHSATNIPTALRKAQVSGAAARGSVAASTSASSAPILTEDVHVATFQFSLLGMHASLSTEVATFSWFDVLSAIGGAYALAKAFVRLLNGPGEYREHGWLRRCCFPRSGSGALDGRLGSSLQGRDVSGFPSLEDQLLRAQISPP